MRSVRKYLILAAFLLVVLWVYMQFSVESQQKDVHQEYHIQGNIPEDPTWNPFGPHHPLDHDKKVQPIVPPGGKEENHVVEIWGKASIGLYLWEHILKAPLEEKLGGVWSFGTTTLNNIKFKTGPGVTPEHAPSETRNLILVLNGMLPEKIEFSKKWLDSLTQFKHLENVAVMLLGDEGCHNEWMHPYLKKNGGLISLVFVVYDSPEVDNDLFFQWPLGVATYRQFPRITDIDSTSVIRGSRPYLCNYLATVYTGSSRESLLNILKTLPTASECIVKPRMEWLPSETNMTRQVYIDALKESDLTLHAAGKNAECYRLYEALAYGSYPIVEDAIGITKGQCNTPFRQLKEHGTPVMFVKDWKDVGAILEKEKLISQDEKFQRRKKLMKWYEEFLESLKMKFVKVVERKFFLRA